METKCAQGSSIPEIGEDSSYSRNNAIEKLNQGPDREPVNVDKCVKKKVHRFYFVKFWPYEDQNLKSRIAEAEKLIEKIEQEKLPILKKFRKISSYQYHHDHVLSSQLGRLYNRKYTISETLNWKTEKLDDLQEAIDSCSHRRLINRVKIWTLNYVDIRHRTKNLATEKILLREMKESQQKGAVDHPCSSVEKFSQLIGSMSSKIKSLDRNKDRNKILKKIKWLEKLGKESIENATEKGNIGNPLFSIKTMHDRVKLINKKLLEEFRKEQLEVRSKISSVEKDLEVSRKDFKSLWIQLYDIQMKQEEVELHIKKMMKQHNETKARYDGCVSTLSSARDLARKKDIKSLEELSLREVNKCMSKWNTSQEFRCDYEKSILLSLDRRRLSCDGRIRNLDEEPINQQY